MLKRSNVIFVIDGSFEGFLCSLFFGFSEKIVPADVVDETYQMDLFHQTYQIVTHEAKANRVAKGIIKQGGYQAFRELYLAFLCVHEERYYAMYQFACMILTEGKRANYAISTGAGSRVMQLSKFVLNEAQMMKEIIRFSVLEHDVLFAKFAPKSDCMEPVLDHFSRRFSAMGVMLCDTVHKRVGVFQPPKEKMILSVDQIPNPEYGEEEQNYRKLWKQFFQSVAIKERYNPKCQNTHLPKRYRMYMTEFLE
ncbi:MAG: DNA metabolism protein [Ruminococcaceae bacterium]|nr:DNA metabolism protein [Oscillospiraceae bacterium]